MSLSPLRPIILIDDSADDIVFAQHRLDRGGVRNPIVTFDSSEEALAHLEGLARNGGVDGDGFPSIVFVDIRMPKYDGFDVLRRLRSEKAFAGLKVVMLSGGDEPSDRARALELGADDYVKKFPSPEAFALLVRNAG